MIGALIRKLGFCICKTPKATIQCTRLPENNEADQPCQELVYSSFFLSLGFIPRYSLKTPRALPGELLGKLVKLANVHFTVNG